MYQIEYQTDIEEAIDIHVRGFWLHSFTWKTFLVNFILCPVFMVMFFYKLQQPGYPYQIGIVLIFWAFFLFYTHGPGYRRKARKFILKNLHGKPYPGTFKCIIDEEGVEADNKLYSFKAKWQNITKIQYYKDYLEFQCANLLIQIRKSEAPELSEMIELWEKHRNDPE